MVQIIEKHNEDSVEWYVSFDGYNPDPENSVLCRNDKEAIKLHDLINNHIRKWYKRELKKSGLLPSVTTGE